MNVKQSQKAQPAGQSMYASICKDLHLQPGTKASDEFLGRCIFKYQQKMSAQILSYQTLFNWLMEHPDVSAEIKLSIRAMFRSR